MLRLANIISGDAKWIGSATLKVRDEYWRNRRASGWIRINPYEPRVKITDERAAQLTRKFFGNPNAKNMVISYSDGSYSDFLNIGAESTPLNGICVIYTGKYIDFYTILQRSNDLDEFIKSWQAMNEEFSRYKNDSSRDFYLSNIDNYDEDESSITESLDILLYARNVGRFSSENGLIISSKRIDRFLPKIKEIKKIINPWTMELTEEKHSISSTPRSMGLNSFLQTRQKKSDVDIGTYRLKATLSPRRSLASWQRSQVQSFPPLPIGKHERPLRPFDKDRRTGIFLMMGVELEVNVIGTTDRGMWADTPGFGDMVYNITSKWPIVPMADGSVSGGEFIGPPGTLSSQIVMWEDILRIINKHALCEVGDNTGLHVHVSRQVFTTLTLGKAHQFINSPSNMGLISYIAGRDSTDHCKRFNRSSIPRSLRAYEDRNTALNIRNDHTVEFRLFKSSLDPLVFFARLEFVDALIRWIYTDQPSLRKLKVENFKKYVCRSRKTYPHLDNYLKGS